MFAIVIYNPAANKVQIFRDRPGVKPFYYYWDGNLFLFASELKAFHQHPGFKKKINYDALRLYFHHGYIPSPYCIFKNTHKLDPGHRLQIDLKKKKLKKRSYWDIYNVFNKPKLNISFDEAVDELEKILISSFNYRMIADVPVGVFLSGGYDSSCVAALLQKDSSKPLKTFTIGFEKQEFNEGPYAQEVAEHLVTDHQEYRCSEKDAIDLVNLLPEVYDEPIADGGAIPNILVSMLAKEKVKVVLSADGGDEIFAGYTKHFYAKQQYERYFKFPYAMRRVMAL
jgi:asparagine synthase (glutamine-hydrolysing)